VVWGLFIEYYPLEEDIVRFEQSASLMDYLESLRYYRADHAEPRFFRYRKNLLWPNDCGRPIHIGPVTRQLIRFKHFKYRSPEQIQIRLKTRQSNRARGFPGWENSSNDDWNAKLSKKEDCSFDRRNGEYEINGVVLPNHRGSLIRRTMQYAMHGLGLWP
jgi:hypothetical protein